LCESFWILSREFSCIISYKRIWINPNWIHSFGNYFRWSSFWNGLFAAYTRVSTIHWINSIRNYFRWNPFWNGLFAAYSRVSTIHWINSIRNYFRWNPFWNSLFAAYSRFTAIHSNISFCSFVRNSHLSVRRLLSHRCRLCARK